MPDLLPDDPHDRTTTDATRPRDWRNPTPASRYGLVVVGGGTAGLVAAGTGSVLGARVALVERANVGGDCLIAGCVPSKALLRCARAAHAARAGGRFGVDADVRVDFARAMAHVRAARATISRHDAARAFAAEYGVDLFFGDARFAGPDAVTVGNATLHFRRAVLATGSRPVLPDVPGLADAGPLTNETVFNLATRPGRLAVLGGGPLGCEFAQAFARLGSAVTLIDHGPRLLSHDDPRASAVLLDVLRREGVTVLFNTAVTRVDRQGGTTRIVLGHAELTVDAVLVGAGRVADVARLGLDAAGVAHTPAGVTVDDFLRTTNRRVYAAGDVCLRDRYTHAADASARLAAQNALLVRAKRWSRQVVPHVTYTDPEVAGVGPVEVPPGGRAYTVPLADVDRSIADGETDGFVTVTVDRAGRIVAASAVAPRAGDLVAGLTAAVATGQRLHRLAGVICPYPTESDAIKKAADAALRDRLGGWPLRLVRRWVGRGQQITAKARRADTKGTKSADR